MSRKLFSITAIVLGLMLIEASTTLAQTVNVVDKPGDGQWTISFSRKDGPNVFELDTFKKTKAEALQEAERLKGWSNSMDANSSWRLAVILIEGEDAPPPKPPTTDGDGPKLRDPLQNLDKKIDGLSKDLQESLKKVLKESKQDVDSAVKRVKELKEFMVKNTDKLNDDNFKQINGLIADYNGKVDKYKSGPNGAAFSVYPRMNPVSPQAMEKVGKWKQATARKQQLASAKQTLDGEKSRLDQERSALAEEGRSLRAEEARVRSLRQQANAGDGPYKARPSGDVVIDGVFLGYRSYPTYEGARAFAGESGTVLDRNGNGVATPPAQVDSAKLDKAEDDLRERQAEYKRRLEKYRQELLGGYNARLQSHRSSVQGHAADVKSLNP